MKQCSKCHKIKPLSSYYKDKGGSGGVNGWCKECQYEYITIHRTKYRYGISENELNKIFIEQGGVCAICGLSESQTSKYGRMKKLSIDHCHTTNKVRGLLCVACNTGLGGFKDNIDILASAISYLQQ